MTDQPDAGSRGDEGCVFCGIVAGEQPAYVVHEDEHTVSFLDVNPWAVGHTLVVPRRHADDWWDVSRDDARHVAAAAHAVAAMLRERLAPDGLNLVQATRVAGWQTVFHLHVHVVPRWEDDGMHQPTEWILPAGTVDLADVAARIARAG